MMRCSRASEKLRVRDEIEILSDFDHPNVLRLIGAYEDSENFIQGKCSKLFG
jgi:serine/threonine protein kinase